MRTFLWNLLSCSLIMTALSLLFGLLCHGLRGRFAAKWRYYSWQILLLGYLSAFLPRLAPAIVTVSSPPIPSTSAVSAGSGAMASDALDPFLLLLLLWVVGVLAVLGRAVYQHAAFCRMTRRYSKPIADEEKLVAAQDLFRRLHIRRQIPLFSCPCVATPMMLGLFHPRILFPAQSYSQEAWRLILHHELIHSKRLDIVIKILLVVVRAVHWFNPLMPAISRLVQRECEIACDEAVIQDAPGEVKKRYCQAILSVVAGQHTPVTAFSTNFVGGKQVLKRRLAEILQPGQKRAFALIPLCICVAVVCGGLLFRVEASSSAQTGDGSTATRSPSNVISSAQTNTTQDYIAVPSIDHTYTTVIYESQHTMP